VRRVSLTTFILSLSWNLRASNCWNSLGLYRPVQGCTDLYRHCFTNGFTHARPNVPKTEESTVKYRNACSLVEDECLGQTVRLIVWLTSTKCDDPRTSSYPCQNLRAAQRWGRCWVTQQMDSACGKRILLNTEFCVKRFRVHRVVLAQYMGKNIQCTVCTTVLFTIGK
jgi:hypothetical protein